MAMILPFTELTEIPVVRLNRSFFPEIINALLYQNQILLMAFRLLAVNFTVYLILEALSNIDNYVKKLRSCNKKTPHRSVHIFSLFPDI